MSEPGLHYTETLHPLAGPPRDLLSSDLKGARIDIQNLFKALGGNAETSLVDVLHRTGIKRVVECGAGTDLRAAHLLAKAGVEVILADPRYSTGLPSEDQLEQQRLTFKPTTVAELAVLVAQGKMASFDLILSKGLLSMGALLGKGGPKEWYAKAQAYAQSMVECLSPNPQALIAASAKHGGSLLLCFDPDIERMDLEKAYAVPMPCGGTGEEFFDIMVSRELLEPTTQPYEFLALRRKKS